METGGHISVYCTHILCFCRHNIFIFLEHQTQFVYIYMLCAVFLFMYKNIFLLPASRVIQIQFFTNISRICLLLIVIHTIYLYTNEFHDR